MSSSQSLFLKQPRSPQPRAVSVFAAIFLRDCPLSEEAVSSCGRVLLMAVLQWYSFYRREETEEDINLLSRHKPGVSTLMQPTCLTYEAPA